MQRYLAEEVMPTDYYDVSMLPWTEEEEEAFQVMEEEEYRLYM